MFQCMMEMNILVLNLVRATPPMIKVDLIYVHILCYIITTFIHNIITVCTCTPKSCMYSLYS